MSELSKKEYYNILYGYYQSLLTDKQKTIFDSYYAEDYSLSEIAEDFKVSRNAVWDTLKKVTDKLEEFESKLHLYDNNIKLNQYLNELEKCTNAEGQSLIQYIREME